MVKVDVLKASDAVRERLCLLLQRVYVGKPSQKVVQNQGRALTCLDCLADWQGDRVDSALDWNAAKALTFISHLTIRLGQEC